MGKKKRVWGFLWVIAAVLVLLCFLGAVERVEDSRRAEGREQLEETLRRTAAACYAAEGVYPPDLAYMEEHYGVRVGGEYVVIYEPVASNLMPDITVLEREE